MGPTTRTALGKTAKEKRVASEADLADLRADEKPKDEPGDIDRPKKVARYG